MPHAVDACMHARRYIIKIEGSCFLHLRHLHTWLASEVAFGASRHVMFGSTVDGHYGASLFGFSVALAEHVLTGGRVSPSSYSVAGMRSEEMLVAAWFQRLGEDVVDVPLTLRQQQQMVWQC